MTSKTPINQTLPQNQYQSDSEIDLRQVVGALLRHWPLIACGGAIGLIHSGLQLLTSKPVYQGEFQIVLSQEKNQSSTAALLSQNPALAMFSGLSGTSGNDSIATEIQILNSPSVLKPVFDEVKARRPDSKSRGMRFRDWAKTAITVEAEEGTSVLNVEFRDSDKKLVLPITKMISQEYQNYSNRSRSRELTNVVAYLRSQIAKIKPQAEASSRTALDYGYANGLGLLDGLPLAGIVAGAPLSTNGSLWLWRPSSRQRRQR